MRHRNPDYSILLTTVVLFAIAMAYVESAVVVYLRAWLLPHGLEFDLSAFPPRILVAEVGREAATMVMLATAAVIAGRTRWDRFGYFLILFGIWDIFYYVWLKVLLDWPESLFEMDFLFLLPEPWLGPVIAPCLVAATMVAVGIGITWRISRGLPFRATLLSWILALTATVIIYLSFTLDFDPLAQPSEYPYWMLLVGLIGYAIAFWHALRSSAQGTK